MTKWHGMLGFEMPEEETAPGVWSPPTVIEREYYGQILHGKKDIRRAEKLVDDISFSNKISVLADPFANEHLGLLRYITYAGSRWELSSVSPEYPRLIFELGGLYHGPITD